MENSYPKSLFLPTLLMIRIFNLQIHPTKWNERVIPFKKRLKSIENTGEIHYPNEPLVWCPSICSLPCDTVCVLIFYSSNMISTTNSNDSNAWKPSMTLFPWLFDNFSVNVYFSIWIIHCITKLLNEISSYRRLWRMLNWGAW